MSFEKDVSMMSELEIELEIEELEKDIEDEMLLRKNLTSEQLLRRNKLYKQLTVLQNRR